MCWVLKDISVLAEQDYCTKLSLIVESYIIFTAENYRNRNLFRNVIVCTETLFWLTFACKVIILKWLNNNQMNVYKIFSTNSLLLLTQCARSRSWWLDMKLSSILQLPSKCFCNHLLLLLLLLLCIVFAWFNIYLLEVKPIF